MYRLICDTIVNNFLYFILSYIDLNESHGKVVQIKAYPQKYIVQKNNAICDGYIKF